MAVEAVPVMTLEGQHVLSGQAVGILLHTRFVTWSKGNVKLYIFLIPYFMVIGSVADPDPGSGAFLAPGSWMGRRSGSRSGMNNPDNISATIFG
jgi:hypothetical protein